MSTQSLPCADSPSFAESEYPPATDLDLITKPGGNTNNMLVSKRITLDSAASTTVSSSASSASKSLSLSDSEDRVSVRSESSSDSNIGDREEGDGNNQVKPQPQSQQLADPLDKLPSVKHHLSDRGNGNLVGSGSAVSSKASTTSSSIAQARVPRPLSFNAKLFQMNTQKLTRKRLEALDSMSSNGVWEAYSDSTSGAATSGSGELDGSASGSASKSRTGSQSQSEQAAEEDEEPEYLRPAKNMGHWTDSYWAGSGYPRQIPSSLLRERQQALGRAESGAQAGAKAGPTVLLTTNAARGRTTSGELQICPQEDVLKSRFEVFIRDLKFRFAYDYVGYSAQVKVIVYLAALWYFGLQISAIYGKILGGGRSGRSRGV